MAAGVGVSSTLDTEGVGIVKLAFAYRCECASGRGLRAERPPMKELECGVTLEMCLDAADTPRAVLCKKGALLLRMEDSGLLIRSGTYSSVHIRRGGGGDAMDQNGISGNVGGNTEYERARSRRNGGGQSDPMLPP